jgi:hypothetical protein
MSCFICLCSSFIPCAEYSVSRAGAEAETGSR